METVPDGGCLHTTDCPSGSSCNCGYLNINFATAGCDSHGTCVTAQPACDPHAPADILCDVDGGCHLGGTCGGHGYCTGACMPSADASSDSAIDSGIDAGMDAAADVGAIGDSAFDSPSTDATPD
jgi:hypothetical protein